MNMAEILKQFEIGEADLSRLESGLFSENKCNFSNCRYNRNSICHNEDKRKECVDVSMKVLCLEGNQNG